jgi:hypothetical protein
MLHMVVVVIQLAPLSPSANRRFFGEEAIAVSEAWSIGGGYIAG